MSIYKSKAGKEKSLALYDKQLLKLDMPFSDIYVKTSFGKTHIVETGNRAGKPRILRRRDFGKADVCCPKEN